MKRELLALSVVLLLTTSFVPLAHSQTYPEYEQEWNWSKDLYRLAKVNINFPYTNNNSIRDISCLGLTSLYQYSGGPENIMFQAEDIDTYRYTVEVFYKDITAVKITVGVWSGSQPPDEDEYNFYTMHLTIHVILRVSEEPKYPTAEETAEATFARVERTFVNLTRTLEQKITHYEQLFLLETVAIIMLAIMVVVMAVVVIRWRGK